MPLARYDYGTNSYRFEEAQRGRARLGLRKCIFQSRNGNCASVSSNTTKDMMNSSPPRDYIGPIVDVNY
jgi:hypothetical protein